MKNEQNLILAVGGDFTQEELRELSGLLSDNKIAVYPYKTNAFEVEEVVRLVFENFDAITFLRDGILFEILWGTLERAKQWALAKKPKAKIMPRIDLRFKTKIGEIPVNMGLPIENLVAQKEIEKTLTVEFLEGFKEGDIVNVYWDTEKNKVSVTKL